MADFGRLTIVGGRAGRQRSAAADVEISVTVAVTVPYLEVPVSPARFIIAATGRDERQAGTRHHEPGAPSKDLHILRPLRDTCAHPR